MSQAARRRLAWTWLDLGPALELREAYRHEPVPGTVGAGPSDTASSDTALADTALADTGASDIGPSDIDSFDADLFDTGSSDTGAHLAIAPPSALDPPPVDPSPVDPAVRWLQLQEEVRGCTACDLARTRRHTVFGVGARTAELMIIGEAPGAEEDARGEPFVGQAGRLLDLMLAEIGLTRGEQVFICNVLKCRPPNNRNPLPQEVAACSHFLEEQVRLVRPRAVLLLGSFAIRSVLKTESSVGNQRGSVHRRTIGGVELPIVASYHPAYLLRNPVDKRKSWEDLLRLAEVLEQARADATG